MPFLVPQYVQTFKMGYGSPARLTFCYVLAP